MAKKFDNDSIERVCAFCEHATPLPPDTDGNVNVLCAKKGLVRERGLCRKFIYDPLKREPASPLSIPEFEAVNIDE